MKHWMKLGAVVALTLASTALRAETPDEAKALLDRALAEIKTSGLDKAVKDFNAGGNWKKGGLYVVAVQLDGTMLAHSANDKLPGKNMLEAKDAGGKAFVKDAISLVKSSGGGQIDMRWGNPVTKQIADATMFVRRVPGQEVYLGSVVFK